MFSNLDGGTYHLVKWLPITKKFDAVIIKSKRSIVDFNLQTPV